MIRRTIVIVLALLAAATVVAPAFLGASDRDAYEAAVQAVLRDDDRNNIRAEGSPQQQVVNGWTARDLLVIQTAQQNDALELQSRQMALLLVIVLLLAWTIVTSSTTSKSDDGHDPQTMRTGTLDTSPAQPLPQRPTPPRGEGGGPAQDGSSY